MRKKKSKERQIAAISKNNVIIRTNSTQEYPNGWQSGKQPRSIIKIFAKNGKELENPIETITIYTQGIRM